MTRARALKQIIRARAAKTGERYTTARRHVLKSLQQPEPRTEEQQQTMEPPKPPVPDTRIREKTGHGLDHWFDLLDRFGGIDKGHTALARHLNGDHGVPGWYAQSITVAYERARGARMVHQRADGRFEVSVSKTIGATTADVVAALADKRARGRWTKDADPDVTAALLGALDAPSAKGIVTRADGLARFRYKWAESTVQLYVIPKPDGRSSFVATQANLPSRDLLETRRQQWRRTLGALAGSWTPKKAAR